MSHESSGSVAHTIRTLALTTNPPNEGSRAFNSYLHPNAKLTANPDPLAMMRSEPYYLRDWHRPDSVVICVWLRWHTTNSPIQGKEQGELHYQYSTRAGHACFLRNTWPRFRYKCNTRGDTRRLHAANCSEAGLTHGHIVAVLG